MNKRKIMHDVRWLTDLDYIPSETSLMLHNISLCKNPFMSSMSHMILTGHLSASQKCLTVIHERRLPAKQ